MADDLQTPYTDAIASVPSGAADDGGVKGGYDFPDGRKESPNSVSGLPPLPTTVNPGPDAPGINDVIGMPAVDSPRTIPTKGVGVD
jgi:hypothetical protein